MGRGVNGRGVGKGEVEVGAKVGVGRSVPAGVGVGVSRNSAGGVKKNGVIVVRSGVGEAFPVQAEKNTHRKRMRMVGFLDTWAL
jgi:hypothetical protein